MIRRMIPVLVAAVAILSAPHAARAENKCAEKKIKVGAKSIGCQLKLDSKEVAKAVAKDPAKVAKCLSGFAAAFAKLEAKGGCLTTNDATAVDSTIGAFVADVDAALSIGAPNKCQGAKIKAAAKKAGCKLKLEAKRAGKGGAIDLAKWTKCEANFDAAFAKLELKGGCATTGDAAAVEATVDAAVDDLADALNPGLPSVGIAPILHVDASTALNLTLTGNEVDGATDLSGNGNHMAPSAALTNKPTYEADGIIAGLGAIRFANGKALQANPDAPFDTSTFTAFVVFRAASYDSWNFVIGDDNYTWSSGWGLEAAGDQLGAYVHAGGPSERVAVATDTTYVAAVVFDAAAIVAYVNGTLSSSDATVAGYDPTPFKLSIGNSDYNQEPWGLDGWIGEVVFFPGVLSAVDRDAITAYLVEKWT